MAKRTPKAIGTRAESACRDWLKTNGWPTCDRQPLRGNRDHGDLIVCHAPKIVAEVKAGKTAEKASDGLIRDWLLQTEDEAVNAGADLGVLIVRRFGRPPALWDAYMPSSDWITILTNDSVLPQDAPWPLRSSLADWSTIAQGWADS